MKTEYEYIKFSQASAEPKRKTPIWVCTNRKHGHYLGQIVWYGAWRQYVLTVGGVTFSEGCLADIQDFLQQAKDAHTKKLAKAKTHRPPIEPDSDFHCKRCGLEWPDPQDTEEPHQCPPGFLD